MDRVFIYWDNSNIFFGALDEAEEREGKAARHRIRIHFKTMLRLAHADRPVERALAAGSVPPEMQALWNRLSGAGVQVELFDRGAVDRGEQQTPDRVLQLQMLRDCGLQRRSRHCRRSHRRRTGVLRRRRIPSRPGEDASPRLARGGALLGELPWANSCNQRMRQWVEAHGVFVPLDDFYEQVTFLVPWEGMQHRYETDLDLSRRRMVAPQDVQQAGPNA